MQSSLELIELAARAGFCVLAAAYPERIEAAVLSASALVDAGFRARHAKPSRVDGGGT